VITVLSKPVYGWSNFQLEQTSAYDLSYVNDIAFEWVDQAIHGLETMLPFCVKGFMEPDRFLCVVSYWNCHIIQEDDERLPLGKDDVVNECSHTGMLRFCHCLSHDIRENIDDWVMFTEFYEDIDVQKRKEDLTRKLDRLDELISERQSWFTENRCFL